MLILVLFSRRYDTNCTLLIQPLIFSRTYRIGVVTKFIYKAEVWDNGSHVKLFGRINFPDSCIAIDCGPEPRLPYPT
ncbi:hypothetical protein ANTRET_LOCUS2072 [Anthophora retusa]